MHFFNNHSVSIIDGDWKYIKEVVKVKHIPRSGEIMFLEMEGGDEYYRVLNVVHYIMKKHGIFLIVEKMESPLKS